MLKSKNQVALFINYSYNSFYDLCSFESKQKVMCRYGIFDIFNTRVVHLFCYFTNGKKLHWCLLTKVTSNYQLFIYGRNLLQHKITANLVS